MESFSRIIGTAVMVFAYDGRVFRQSKDRWAEMYRLRKMREIMPHEQS